MKYFFIGLFVGFAPYLTIWTLNTLFYTGIIYDWRSVAAASWFFLCSTGIVRDLIYGSASDRSSPSD